MFATGDVVELTEDMPEYGLRRGELGTVVGLHRDHRTYTVAFARDSGALGTYDVPYLVLRRRVDRAAPGGGKPVGCA